MLLPALVNVKLLLTMLPGPLTLPLMLAESKQGLEVAKMEARITLDLLLDRPRALACVADRGRCVLVALIDALPIEVELPPARAEGVETPLKFISDRPQSRLDLRILG